MDVSTAVQPKTGPDFAAPVEQWMVALHPEQQQLVSRTFDGPARIRGSAGTGKSVVALHRARVLAQRYDEPVLFTTYAANLPRIFARLFHQLAPDLGPRRVAFTSLHALAYRALRAARIDLQIDADGAYSAYNEAYRGSSAQHPRLRELGWRYLRDEIDWVIKGRGMSDGDAYLALERTGRGTPLDAGTRRAVWDLFERYQRGLARRGLIDFGDLLVLALTATRDGRLDWPYRCVIVDEAQDLTEIGTRLVALIGGAQRPDGLLLVGDERQAVYPGGFVLSRLGIEVRGRAHRLVHNHRNAAAVVRVASSLAMHSSPAASPDPEHGAQRGTSSPAATGEVWPSRSQRESASAQWSRRRGGTACFEGFGDPTVHDDAVVAVLQRWTTSISPASGGTIDRIDHAEQAGPVDPGDLAVLVASQRLVDQYVRVLSRGGIPVEPLERYAGRRSGRVKVGTYQRAKGLEFKRVVLPRLDTEGLGSQRRSGEDATSYEERLALLTRRLFVAITRARDAVWGSWVGDVAPMLEPVAAVAHDAGVKSPSFAREVGRPSAW